MPPLALQVWDTPHTSVPRAHGLGSPSEMPIAQGGESPALEGLEGEELGNAFPAVWRRASRLGLVLVGVGVGGITDQLPVRLRVLGGPPGQEQAWQELPLGMWLAMASRGRVAASRALIPHRLSDRL